MTVTQSRSTSPHRERVFERLVIQTSATVTSVPDSEIEVAIVEALGHMGRFFDVDQIVLSRRQDDSNLRIAFSWSASPKGNLTKGLIWSPMIPASLKSVLEGEVVSFSFESPLDDTADELAVDRETFREMGEKSHISVPIQVDHQILGALSLVVRSRDCSWSDELPGRLGLLAEILGNAIVRQDRESQISEAIDRIAGLERQLLEESGLRNEKIGTTGEIEQLIGTSPQIQNVIRHAELVAQTNATVLLLGETGTGKGLLARLVHRKSQRSSRPLITVNCAALPDTLIESELFGHEKGAFTGALQRRVGRFELADRGTIFLDEVGDLPLDLQAKLLRVLQDQEFERLGSTVTKKVDVRVIAATNRDLATAVEEGRFRADLYYRLKVVPIELSSLREQREDIPLLLWHFLNKYQAELGKTINRIPQDVVDRLICYDWPGNVRELANVVERAVIFTQGKTLVVEETLAAGSKSKAEDNSTDDLQIRERTHIIDVLDQCGWKVKGLGNAAERVGLHPSTLRARMKKLDINRPRRIAS